jgi:acyl-CoA synthetase (AMP-forming)/AMP-acid ligase II
MLLDALEGHVAERPTQTAFRFVGGPPGVVDASITFAELAVRARGIAASLAEASDVGDRVILAFAPGLEFIAAFFGCLFAGRIAVPAYPPRDESSREGLHAIIQNAGAKLGLSVSQLIPFLDGGEAGRNASASGPRWLAVDALAKGAASSSAHRPDARAIAFLQYTSGSTASPRGVMVTHANLAHNLAWLERRYEVLPASRFVNWLPPYHDMGLIGAILLPVFSGASATLQSPLDFIARPLQWLRLVSATGGTHSACPNFAFEHCVNRTTPEQRAALELGRWRFVLNGAEPVWAETLERFAAAFAPSGFARSAFEPCYGLAEATLIAAGHIKTKETEPIVRWFSSAALAQSEVIASAPRADGARALVGCGHSLGDQRLLIVDPVARAPSRDGAVGEIWISGPSVGAGYWNRPDETAEVFGAELAEDGDGPFLRTGDLGFLQDGELFVVGRIKDVLIFDGKNHHPQDVESSVERCHPAIRRGCVAAVGVEADGGERLVVVAEIDLARAKRSSEDAESDETKLRPEIVRSIRSAVSSRHGLSVHAVVLLAPGGIPKTSSGKLRRHQCRARYASGEWPTQNG